MSNSGAPDAGVQAEQPGPPATPYLRFMDGELILRDELAIDRTLLANERTVLAYLRSAAALVLAGASIAHFSHESWFWALGIACLPAGLAVGVFGSVRFHRMSRGICAIRRRSRPGPNPLPRVGPPPRTP
jgi:putative membrane protein